MTDIKELDALRDKIDQIDAKIVELLNERAGVVLKIRDMKIELGLPRHDPDREAEVMVRLAEVNKGPLPDNALQRIYEHVLYHMRLFPKVDWNNNES